jgi:hypothetical protein
MIPFIQDLILKDFWLKLFSLALASLTWFTVNIAIKNDITPAASFSLAPTEQVVLHDLPIVVLAQAESSHEFSINPKTASVTLQGDPVNLKNLRKQDVRVLVDLSNPGKLPELTRKIEVYTPAGLTHVRVDPEEVQIIIPAKN